MNAKEKAIERIKGKINAFDNDEFISRSEASSYYAKEILSLPEVKEYFRKKDKIEFEKVYKENFQQAALLKEAKEALEIIALAEEHGLTIKDIESFAGRTIERILEAGR